MTAGWDDVARDRHGAALSAGEVCQRDTCWHRWLDHDHAFSPRESPGFGYCLIPTAAGRCRCPGFLSGDEAMVAPTPFAAAFPEEPAKHARAEP